MDLIAASSWTRNPSWFTFCLIWFLYYLILQAEWKKRIFLSPNRKPISLLFCLSKSSSNCSQCRKSAFRFLSAVCHPALREFVPMLSWMSFNYCLIEDILALVLIFSFFLHYSIAFLTSLSFITVSYWREPWILTFYAAVTIVFETLALQPIIKEPWIY